MKDEGATYECPFCGIVSHNPNDARAQYCGACHLFAIDSYQAVKFLEARRFAMNEIAHLFQVPREVVKNATTKKVRRRRPNARREF